MESNVATAHQTAAELQGMIIKIKTNVPTAAGGVFPITNPQINVFTYFPI